MDDETDLWSFLLKKATCLKGKIELSRSLGLIFHSLIDAWFSKLFTHFLKVSPFCWCCMTPIFIGVVLEICFYFSLFLHIIFASFYNWLADSGAPVSAKGEYYFWVIVWEAFIWLHSFKISTNGNFVVHESQRGGPSYELLMQNYCLSANMQQTQRR